MLRERTARMFDEDLRLGDEVRYPELSLSIITTCCPVPRTDGLSSFPARQSWALEVKTDDVSAWVFGTLASTRNIQLRVWRRT